MRRIIGLSLCVFLITGSVSARDLRSGKVAFWSYDTDNFPHEGCIYVMNADGSGVTQLLRRDFQEGGRGFGVDGIPALSPDCQRLLFGLWEWGVGLQDIAAIELDSGEIVNLTNGELERCRDPRWSPDGSQIVFCSSGDTRELCVMNWDGTGVRIIGEGSIPDWSLDGRRIAFTRDRMDIYTMNVDGSNVKYIATSPKVSIRMLRWSHDGKRLLFTTYTNNDIGRIYIVDSNGDNLTLLREESISVCWSPDGKKIAFGRGDNEDSFWHGSHIWLMNPDGSGLERLTDNERGEADFDWRDPSFLGMSSFPDAVATLWGAIKTQEQIK